jgi:hypothetical protein
MTVALLNSESGSSTLHTCRICKTEDAVDTLVNGELRYSSNGFKLRDWAASVFGYKPPEFFVDDTGYSSLAVLEPVKVQNVLSEAWNAHDKGDAGKNRYTQWCLPSTTASGFDLEFGWILGC